MYIKEQLARNMYTQQTMPNTFEDYPDYDIDTHADVNGQYMLTVKFKDEKIAPIALYKDYDEAHHQARMIIDKHRVQVMHGSSKET